MTENDKDLPEGQSYMSSVECSGCGACVKARGGIDAVDKAIEKWNRRV